MNDIPAPKPSSGTELVLESVGRRYASGSKLTMSDENMAYAASAQEVANAYGPSVSNFTVNGPELPETVKGALIKHST